MDISNIEFIGLIIFLITAMLWFITKKITWKLIQLIGETILIVSYLFQANYLLMGLWVIVLIGDLYSLYRKYQNNDI